MQLILPVRRYLTNRHITVPEDWLSACIDWVLSEYSQNKVSILVTRENVIHMKCSHI